MRKKVKKDKDSIKMLIISSCTGEKAPPPKMDKSDFEGLMDTIAKFPNPLWHDPTLALLRYLMPAIRRYTGEQHKHVVKGLNMLRYKDLSVDLNILSAGYGLIKENDLIADYDLTFSRNSEKKDFPTDCDIRDWSTRLRIREKVIQAIRDYDIVFFLLGQEYLIALNFVDPFSVAELKSLTGKKLVFFTPNKEKTSLDALMTGETFACFVDCSIEEGVNGNSLAGTIQRKGYMLESFAKNVELSNLKDICACTDPSKAEEIITELI